MPATRPANILRQFDAAEADADLLARFARARDQAAFAALVRRHGPMVLAVCRRVTGHPQDAEDAFQAAFLVLARKAGAVGNPALLGNWLYGVAVRLARRARRAAARRRVWEVQVITLPDPPAPPFETPGGVGPELHEELAKLPAWYRDALLLCDLQGLSRSDAAKRLGVPEGTLSSRLASGRKRLADRLARRGVVVPAAAVPAVLSDGRAVAVSDQLVTKTCGLVADWAAGGAVPGPLLRLADGGFGMRQTFLLGAVGLALATAGGVVGSRGDDPPKPDNPPAAKAEPRLAEPANAEPKEVGITTRPRLRQTIDLDLTAPVEMMWSPTGTELAVRGTHQPAPVNAAGGPAIPSSVNRVYTYRAGADGVESLPRVDLPVRSRLIGFSADGKQLVTDLREGGLVSGRHRLYVQNVDNTNAGNRMVELDADPTQGYAFAPDRKTYRTVYQESSADTPGRVEVREVSTATGRTVKVPFAVDGAFGLATLSADGKRLAGFGADDRVTVYDVDSGIQLWSRVVDLKKPNQNSNRLPQESGLGFSPDGGRLLVSESLCVPALLDASTGEPAVELEGTSFVQMLPQPGSFSADGRLFAASGQRLIRHEEPPPKGSGKSARPQMSFSDAGKFLTVWDTRTGKVVKSWKGVGEVAFHPTKPILAVLEPNPQRTQLTVPQTRLGVWDFAADGQK